VDTNKTITHLSLCSGYEGIGHGLRRVLPTLREIAFVEREGFPIANLENKMQKVQLDTAPIHTDLKTFPYRKFRGCVDILSGGFPCQPFSAAGKRQATEDPRHLFPYIADGIRECEPRIVFLENVQGILSCTTGDGEPVLKYVLRTLEEMGYRATAGIFSAEEVGAPHQRKRVYILGYASSLGSYRGIENQNDEQSEVSREGLERVRGGEDSFDGARETGQLGNSDSQRCEGERLRRDEEQSEGVVSRRSSEELGNSDSGRLEGSEEEGRNRGNAVRSSEELADCKGEGLEGHSRLRSEQDWGCEPSSQGLWPARPSEPQYEWEEPRVVVNSTSKGLEGGRGQSLQGADQGLAGTDRSDGQTEPQLGGATDGSTSRVDATVNRIDRLRLLGNGVVPMTAAKAFVTLIQRVI